jgi:hypothetical protein
MKKKTSNKGGYRCTGNVMTPINWFGGVFETVLIPTGASQHDNWFGIACIVLAAAMFLAYLGIYIYFALTDPNRLQSEEFNLYQQELTVDHGEITVITSSHNITNALPEGADSSNIKIDHQ